MTGSLGTAGPRGGLIGYYVRSSRIAVGHERSNAGDANVGLVMAFVAGAINAGGFLAVGRYTSHMSGVVSAMADDLALGATALAGAGLASLLPFMAGAAVSGILVNWGRRHRQHTQYALPLLLEAVLLFGFGALGGFLPHGTAFLAVTIPLLCFIMGLQNATVTKASGARIRTTHVTGIVTDIGIELGKLAYWNRSVTDPTAPRVVADRGKLALLAALLISFFLGGVTGAVGFKHIGYVFSLPLGVFLLLIAVPALLEERRHAPI